MNILLLGGSNAGLHYGWAAQLQAMAGDHAVTNRFLGAVGSLYGLLRLMEMEREGEAAPDLLVFEYALNDAVLMDAGWLRVDLLDDTLDEVAQICARWRVPLLLLCLELRPTGRRRVNRAVARVKDRYRRAAQRHGLSRCLTLKTALGGVRREDFADKHHLNDAASRRVAEVVLETIRAQSAPAPRESPDRRSVFSYTPAREARSSGPCRRTWIDSTVYRGEFLEIARGGASRWKGEGLVAGLMLRSTQDAGVYSLGTQGAAYRKTPQSSMREIVPKLILLHYSKRQPEARDDLEIAMPEDEEALMRLEEDHSMLPATSPTPFPEQILQIAGVMFWRKPAWARRWWAILLAKRDAGSLFPQAARK